MNNQMRRVYGTLTQGQIDIIESARQQKIREILGGRKPNDPEAFAKIKAKRQKALQSRR